MADYEDEKENRSDFREVFSQQPKTIFFKV